MGAISLVSNPPTKVSDIYNDLITFGFSFLFLITMWLRYTRIMSVLPLETRRGINLNIMLLFCVSVEPFLFNLVRNPPVGALGYSDATSTLYALDLGSMFVILGGFDLTLANEERKLIPKELMRRYKIEGLSYFFCGLIFMVTAVPIFWTVRIGGEALRYDLWAVPLLLLWILRRTNRLLDFEDTTA